MRARLAAAVAVLLAPGCASAPAPTTPPASPAPPPAAATRVEAGVRMQGVGGAFLPSGDLLVVGGGHRALALRSSDRGRSLVPVPGLPAVAGLTPDVLVAGGRALIALTGWHRDPGAGAGEPAAIGGVLLLRALGADAHAFAEPIEIAPRGVDPRLLALPGGRLLCLAIEDGTDLAVHASDDGGVAWRRLASAVRAGTPGPADPAPAIEDGRAIVLDGGEILYAYEREREEGADSTIELVRSADGGMTWSAPRVLWRPRAPADLEPGGFHRARDGALIFFYSSDEPPAAPGSSYAGARVRALVSRDRGVSWQGAGVVVAERDQLIFDVVAMPARGPGGGGALLLTIRHWLDGSRTLAVYRLDPPALTRLASPRRLDDASAR